MKLVRRSGSTSQSCSCTSCVYKSESEQPSFRKYIAHGSRIDRLYYGKYIPLRERKLLNRLVRTRAVYDDLRARLISDSTLSLDENRDLRPRKQHHAVKTLGDTENSGAILELVDFIDKGATLGPRKISECCSCCSCSSKIKLVENDKREHKYKRAYPRTYDGEYDRKVYGGTGERGLARIYKREYEKTVGNDLMGDRFIRRGVHFKAKHIRSDPCTCTLKFSGLIKKHSQAMLRKMRPLPLEEPIFNAEEDLVVRKSKVHTFARKSYQKYKDIQDKLELDMRKLNKTRANIKQNLQLKAKKSLEQVKEAKEKVKTKFESGLRKSIQAVKDLQPKDKKYDSVGFTEDKPTFKVKKDSIVKFKDYLKRKEMSKDWECDLECIPDTCVPEECFKIIKLRRSQKRNRRQDRSHAFKYEMIKREARDKGSQLHKSSSNIQVGEYEKTTTTHVKKRKPMLHFDDGDQVIGQRLTLDTEGIKQVDIKDGDTKIVGLETTFPIANNKEYARPKVKKTRNTPSKYEKSKKQKLRYFTKGTGKPQLQKSSSSVQTGGYVKTTATHAIKRKSLPPIDNGNQVKGQQLIFESKEIKKVGIKDRKRIVDSDIFTSQNNLDTAKEREMSSLNEVESDINSRQAVRIGSSFSFNVEFYKTAPNLNLIRSNEPAGDHVTDKNIKQHTRKSKSKKLHRRHKGSQIVLKPSLESSQGNANVTLQKHKTRLIQTPSQCQCVSNVNPSVLLPFECEPFTCIPGDCDPKECVKRINSIKTNTVGKKSVSSLTKQPTLHTANKNVSKDVQRKQRLSQVSLKQTEQKSAVNEISSSQKQAVRIGSTFSFNIEFYKNQDDLKAQHTSTVKKTRSKKKYFSPKLVNVKGTTAKAYRQAKSTMRRCFCTLKLHKMGETKKKVNTSTIGTVTSLGSKKVVPTVVNKYVETKNNRGLKLNEYHLLPFECEPGVCIPGECNPIFCNKLLELRNGPRYRRKSKGSYTSSRKTKSTSSVISRAAASVKTKIVQSSIAQSKPGVTNTQRKEHFNWDRNNLKQTYINAHGRQAVRVGSSFSFNIEFYKDTAPEKALSIPSMTNKVKYKKRNDTEGVRPKHNRHNKSMLSQVINMDKNVGPSLRRCFCSLKLYKNKYAKRRFKNAKMSTVNIQTLNEVPSIGETVNRGTKMKWKNHNVLSYECEPNVCIPGECDPYLCMEKIKRRFINTRDYGTFTNIPEMRSMSSRTENSHNRSTEILVQPRLFRRGTQVKKNYVKKLNVKPKQVFSHTGRPEDFSATNSKQAVRIGSSFNFGIEFSKQGHQVVQLSKYTHNKQVAEVHPKRYKNKGFKVTKGHVGHVDSQTLEPRKNHKASFVRPMLKRCFCTLNLHKKAKPHYGYVPSTLNPRNKSFLPHIYTVSTAMTTRTEIISPKLRYQEDGEQRCFEPKNKIISISTSSFLLKKFGPNSKYSCLKLCPAITVPIKLKQPLKLNSTLSLEVDIIRDLNPRNITGLWNIKRPVKIVTSYTCMNDRLHESKKVNNQLCCQTQNSTTGISRYFEQCFCAMNVQISNEGVPAGKMTLRKKLKSYECEPGICVPGECDPYECQKIIMKRLARNVHKGSGTKSTYKSISSYTSSYGGSDSRSTQFQIRNNKHPQETARQKQQRHGETTQKHAVRVGSSFSFDIEFSKNHFHPLRGYKREKITRLDSRKPLNKNISRGISRDVQIPKPFRKHSQSQSTTSLVHRGNHAPMMKRCFCTLKLQKKGRLHRKHVMLNTPSSKQPPSSESKNVKIGTAKAKYHKIPTVDLHDLRSYECDPGICIPGQCNPYECLEYMKRKKDFGINTSQFDNRSVSSMAREGYFKQKTRAVGAKPIKYRKTTIAPRNFKNIENSLITGRSSRQAVRIGSNFSFNIEFYKDKPELSTEPNSKETIKNVQKINTHGSSARYKEHNKKLKGSISQSIRSVSNRYTQMERPYNQASTMTQSFIKRCFCTSKLQGIDIQSKNSQNTPKFIHKCLCLFGLRNKEVRDNRPEKTRIETAEKRTNTNYGNNVYVSPLKYYECESGICIPGQCDPYICHKIIQRRMAKKYSKGSETGSPITQVVSSGVHHYDRLRNKKTQAQVQKYDKQKKNFKKNKQSDYYQPTVNADKHLVRIGSNFNFNVEFYKENNYASKARDRTTYPDGDVRLVKMAKRSHFKSIGTKSINSSVLNNDSQIAKKGSRTFGSSPTLKRCFCTLKLLNKSTNRFDKAKKINKFDKKSVKKTRTIKTQSNKTLKGQPIQEVYDRGNLSQYECEPTICVPGECDPVECLDRIQRRQVHSKHFGTITEYPHRKSIGIVSTRNNKDENLQTRSAARKQNTQSYVDKIRVEKTFDQTRKSRQAVRIGSNFSFNVEFFKDTGNDAIKIVKNHPPKAPMKQYPKKPFKHHKKIETSNSRHNGDLQLKSTQIQATETGMADTKRCFCTLQLRNKGRDRKSIKSIHNKPNNAYQSQSNHTGVRQFLKKCACAFKLDKIGKDQQLTHAAKYEVKGTSTYNTDAKEDQFINPIKLLEPYECEPYICIPGECDPYDCLKRIQKKQVRDFGTGYKSYLKDSATDSIRGPATRSTKVQFIKERKLNTRGTSFVAKPKGRSKESIQFSVKPPYSTNRQAVRIGSNFSFNVEFFKEHGLPEADYKDNKRLKTDKRTIPKLKTRSEKLQLHSKGSDSADRGALRCKRSQCTYLKRRLTSSASNTVPKRCFCTLKLLKNHHTKLKEKPLSPLKTTVNKMSATKLKYPLSQEYSVYECPPLMCIPGECNPHECLDKMKKRKITRQYRAIGTRTGKTSAVSVGNRTSQIKAHKIQSHYVKTNKNMDRPNKRAVRIGSNFKFNVEFFKQKSQPAIIRSHKKTNDNEDVKSYFTKNLAVSADKFRHNFSQIDGDKTNDQASDAGNKLKRCFCTLPLQKSTRQKVVEKYIHHPGINVKYPQLITVGRVAIEPFNKNNLNTGILSKTDKVKKSAFSNPNLSDNVRTVATKINKKYLGSEEFVSMQCDLSSCPEYKKKKRLRKKNNNDMQTILPYTPSKFNRRESKTFLSDNHKLKETRESVHNKCEDDCRKRDTLMFGQGKRLTAKKSDKSIPRNKLERKTGFKSFFLCRWARLFSRQTEKSTNKGNNNFMTEHKSPEIKLSVKPKNAKYIKFSKSIFGENCPAVCTKNTDETVQNNLQFNRGVAETKNVVKFDDDQSKKHSGRKSLLQHSKMKVTFADNVKHSNNDMRKRKSLQRRSSTRSRLCYSCSVNDCPIKFDKKKDRKVSGVFHLLGNSSKKSLKKSVMHSESADDCQYCECCKRKIDVEEISKGAGDRRLTLLSHKRNVDQCPCDEISFMGNGRKSSIRKSSKTEKLIKKHSVKKDKCCICKKVAKIEDKKPLFEIQIDSVNSEILNKYELRNRLDRLDGNISKKGVTQFSQKQTKLGDSCICCKCNRKLEYQDAKSTKNKLSKLSPTKTALRSKPCTCGSIKCSKESKRKLSRPPEKITREKVVQLYRPCVCGSSICSQESKKIKRKKEHICMCKEAIARRKAALIERRELKRRLKIDYEKNQKQRRKRIKHNKELEDRIKKYKDSGDFLLAVDSVIDVGKLGVSTLSGVLRSTAKAIIDPKVAFEKMKCKKIDSDLVVTKKRFMESDAVATAKRLKMRCLLMKRVQAAKRKLEENAFTHFILHAADRNPKTRKFKRKPVRRIREPLDFQCSLYMASLRKKPYLCVYYKCPWFYPHWLSIVNVWKQFTDIMLFLLAAVVWSPCILCMEGCRALMCCFFCTG